MSTLIVSLPAQPRLQAQHAPPAEAAPGAGEVEFEYLFSADGRQATQHGRARAAELPRADTTVLVLAPQDLGWHRIALPKAPASRLRQALTGVLEEQLLEDEGELHLAVAPEAEAGTPTWIAAVSKPWLQAHLQALEAAGHEVDRVVPAWSPEGPPHAHVHEEAGRLQLVWRDADGLVCLPLHSPAARALVQAAADAPPQWSSCAKGAEEAAGLAGTPVAAETQAEALLRASASPWNLRQFDLAAQRRSQRALREALQRFWREPAWRPVRLGLALLLGVQLVGAHAWAWQQRSLLAERRAALNGLLQQTFPNVRAVFDAPIQMQKEIDLLRSAAGKPGDADLEPLLQAADTAWPANRGPADEVRFDAGRLTLVSAGWTPDDLAAMNSRLAPLGLQAEASPGGVTVSRSRNPVRGPRPGGDPRGPGTNPPATPPGPPPGAAPGTPPAGGTPPAPSANNGGSNASAGSPGGAAPKNTANGAANPGAPQPGLRAPDGNGPAGRIAPPGFTPPGGPVPSGHPMPQPVRPEDQ